MSEGTAYVYDAPYAAQSLSVSIVPVAQLAYYRANFDLERVWDHNSPAPPSTT